jgi:AcrR family transcriptional regulator
LPEGDVALRRAKIIDAASGMFFTDGFETTTLEAIAHEAGVTKRTIYELFGDKSALFRVACDRLRAQGPLFSFDVPVAGRDLREVLHDMARQLIRHSRDPELLTLVRAVMIESTRFPALVSDVIARGKSGLHGVMAAVFEKMIEHGMIDRISPDRAADMFYDVTVGASGFRAALGRPDDAITEADLLERVDMFLHGHLLRSTADRSRTR